MSILESNFSQPGLQAGASEVVMSISGKMPTLHGTVRWLSVSSGVMGSLSSLTPPVQVPQGTAFVPVVSFYSTVYLSSFWSLITEERSGAGL